MENRYLQQLPKPTVKTVFNGSFMGDFETYVTDQFVGRDSWISAKSRTEKLLGKRENNGVYFCAKDTLITRFDAPDPKKLTSNLSYVDVYKRQTWRTSPPPAASRSSAGSRSAATSPSSTTTSTAPPWWCWRP